MATPPPPPLSSAGTPPPCHPSSPAAPNNRSNSEANAAAGSGGGATAGGGVSESLVSPGLTSSLYGSGTFAGGLTGFSSSGYGGSASGDVQVTPGGSGGLMGGGRGDKRSKLVRERSRSSAAFASSSRSPGGKGLKGRDGGGTAGKSPGPYFKGRKQAGMAVGLAGGDYGKDTPSRKKKPPPPMDYLEENEREEKEDDDVTADDYIPTVDEIPILFTSFCYKGLEVIFTAVIRHLSENTDEDVGNTEYQLLGIHARTRVPFQTCQIYNPYSQEYRNKANKLMPQLEIIHLTSHPTTGWIYAADSFGNVHSFYPVCADPEVEAYGKFRWVNGSVAKCREVFGYSPLPDTLSNRKHTFDRKDENEMEEELCCFQREGRKASVTTTSNPNSIPASPGHQNHDNIYTESNQPPLPTHDPDDEYHHGRGIMICASLTEKRVLIAHRDQLAIFDFSCPTLSSSCGYGHDSDSSPPLEALLLWTHKMRVMIQHISLSGDGCAIALVLRGEGVGVPYPYGVRTFVRDRDDGSSAGGSGTAGANAAMGDAGHGHIENSEHQHPSRQIPPPTGKPPKHRRKGSELKARGIEPPPLPKNHDFDGLMERVFGKEGSASNDRPEHNKCTNESAKATELNAKGIVYKPGQFLVHSAPVSRISFRGFGTNTSSQVQKEGWSEDEEGNDLLLTTCASDSSVRIFSQNSWRQLMNWSSPPKSRADWVRGITAANLGDLDSSPTNNTSSKKKKDGPLTPIPKAGGGDGSAYSSSQSPQTHHQPPSDNNSLSSEASGGINRHLLSTHHQQAPTTSSFPSQTVPGTHAGAWIAELTFRNAFPALRLSRLSYMKTGGDDALPAHFESIAAILPPGSINEDVVLHDSENGECRMEVEGIWPAWDPWEPDLSGKSSGEGKDGGYEATFGKLGSRHVVSSKLGGMGSPTGATAGGPRWLGDGADLGGSHIPPSELRITSSHAMGNAIVQIEMPLWGDKDFGAMEFGSPMRYVMAVPEGMDPTIGGNHALARQIGFLPSACLDFESGSRLCARTSFDRRNVELSWIKHGPVNLEELPDSPISFNAESENVDPPKRFKDLSLTPLPLLLPSLCLPGHQHYMSGGIKSAQPFDKHAISSLHWWPDENFGGPPRLVALTNGGTIIVYEMPPPWSALEPPMPSYDPFDSSESRGSSVATDFDFEDQGIAPSMDSFDNDSMGDSYRGEYEVSLTPHPDFGIGLRLEAQAQGMPAIAGSFKKHPLSGGRLPAERSGTITLGDELLAVNDVSLEGVPFEEAISTVRQIGFDSYGLPLRMRFRRCRGRKRSTLPSTSSKSSRRTKGSDIGTPDSKMSTSVAVGGFECGSLATMEVGADAETQQEFGRIIAVVRDAVVGSLDGSMHSAPPAMLLLPWNFGKGATVSSKMYGGALIVWAVPGQRVIRTARLEVVLDIDPENARFDDLGSFDMNESDENNNGNGSSIKTISFVSSIENGWLLAIHDCAGDLSLIFIETATGAPKGSSPRESITSTFRHYPCIFNVHGRNAIRNKHDPRDAFILRSFSIEMFACMRKCREGCNNLNIWEALPQSIPQDDSDESQLEYVSSTIVVSDVQGCLNETILDFRWIASGFVDAFPWLVVFTQKSAIVYHRSCFQQRWYPIVVLLYPTVEHSGWNENSEYRGLLSPYDALPQLVSALRCIILSSDEKRNIRSDWHPEAILANICTEAKGVGLALKSHTKNLYTWLSQWMNCDETLRPSWDGHGPLSNAPHSVVNEKVFESTDDDDDKTDDVQTSANLMAALTMTENTRKPKSDEELRLSDLQSAIAPTDIAEKKDESNRYHAPRSREFMMAMSHGNALSQSLENKKPVPRPLEKLSKDELNCVWAIGEILSNTPSFKNMDSSAQLCVFCVNLMRRLLAINESNVQRANNNVNPYETILRQTSSTLERDKEVYDTAASAAFLSALISDSQGRLLDACRPQNEKFNWESARSVGVPYWVRSEKVISSIAEEIAQSIYKTTKSVMDCALFYVASRKMKTLKAIAATDRSDSGTKFMKFLLAHDFSSDRGRKAAEKNAYSLLRKRKYASAAAFFLLAEPPFIKTALDIITVQMQDPSLAFFVARLIENAPKTTAHFNDALTIGGGFSLSSMGGGGGFAGSGDISGNSIQTEENGVSFSEWIPALGPNSRRVLTAQLEDSSDRDICLECLQLLWLGRPNEAKIRLSRVCVKDALNAVDINAPSFIKPTDSEDSFSSKGSKLLVTANEVINFCSVPSLLKRLKPNKRVLWSSALLASRALYRCGLEIPSIRILLQIADPDYVEESIGEVTKEKQYDNKVQGHNDGGGNLSIFDTGPANAEVGNLPSSSIFDSYNGAPSASKQPKPTSEMNSSIFDSFDAPRPKSQSKSSETQSSIFDSFDTAPQKQGGTTFSIFDSFDTAPKPKVTPPASSTHDPMTSSIFDSFDVAPQQPKSKPPATQESRMTSSIFDSFEAAPQKPKAQLPAAQEYDMASSIFDSFDAAPQLPKAPVHAPKPSGMASSIFDSFEPAPQKTASKVNPEQSDMASSIFDSFDAALRKPQTKTEATAGANAISSIFDSSETPRPKRVSQISQTPSDKLKKQECETCIIEKEQPLDIPKFPTLWNEWRNELINVIAARRFLREVVRIISSFYAEPQFSDLESFTLRSHPLIPTSAVEVLHKSCDGNGLLISIRNSLTELSAIFDLSQTLIIENSLELLSASKRPRRLVLSVILQSLLGRSDFAEDLVRNAAALQTNSSEYLGFSNDAIVFNSGTKYYSSSQWSRRDSASVIWQLELCLWLHRGGAVDLISSTALKETIIAVRVGLAVATWGRCLQNLDTLIKAEPDCAMDFDSGRNLWRSMKIIVVNNNDTVNGVEGVSSGGWEFLVDCRRDEATEMLRDSKTGQFLIRPHVQDPGVFTLSFKTNLIPTETTPPTNYDEAVSSDKSQEASKPSTDSKKVIKRDDVVQHAIIRLTDSGFRCGSFGPFTTLVKLLRAVSDSLPFDLRFHDPPIKGVIKEKGTQASPNSFLFRKMALHSKAEYFHVNGSKNVEVSEIDECLHPIKSTDTPHHSNEDHKIAGIDSDEEVDLHRRFGLFSQLLFLTELRKQLCAVASAGEDEAEEAPNDIGVEKCQDDVIDEEYDGSLSEGSFEVDDEEVLGAAFRMVRPLLCWCRSREIELVDEIAPLISNIDQKQSILPHSVSVNATSDEYEMPSVDTMGWCQNGGDFVIRRMIQSGSGVDFRTLRVGEAGNSVIVVLFGKQDALNWLMTHETGNNEVEAMERLKLMELMRIIEPITSTDLSIPKSYAASHPSTEARYRFVDPWEVEALESKAGETASATLGRGHYRALTVGLIANSCEKIIRSAGGLHLLGLWSTLKGGICLTKALASAHPSWERDAGGDLQMKGGFLMEPSTYDNSIRQHLYGNSLFRRLELPQRFLALLQVELLDLKNVTSPSGSSSLTAYALLRLKRQGSSAPLNHKARSLDSACTQARKISRSSGPNAPASWGSIVRFRFPLPEDVDCEGKSFDADRESLFKGPPTCLQVTVYEKKFMSDMELGGADVNLDSLGSGGQVEEWVPLRAGKDGITWFARIRLSLRFELMCIDKSHYASYEDYKSRCPSVGLRKIQKLSRLGAHEDSKGVKHSISTPDVMGYFGNMLY